MTQGLFRVLRASALAGIAIGATVVVQATPVSARDAYSRAHDLLQAAYPGLSGHGLVFTVNGDRWIPYDGTPLQFLSMVMTVGRQDPRGHDPVKPVLSARIEFALDQTVLDLNIDGEYANEEKLSKLEQLAETKPDASAAEVASRLRSLGVRFGADQAKEMREEALRQFGRIQRVLGRIQLKEIGLLDNGTL